jgi:hypothetical protein
MCVSPQALLSAVVNRVESGGKVPDANELRALIGAGCTKEHLREAFERGAARAPTARFADALAVVSSL